MAQLVVNSTIITNENQNTILVNFVCDETLTDVKLSVDNGITFMDCKDFNQTIATFDISSLKKGVYICKIKGFYYPTPIDNGGGSDSTSPEYEQSCTSEYILDKMYPMGQSHEAIPSGPITDDWKHQSRWENQYRPRAIAHNCGDYNCPGTGLFQALGCWANIYRVEGTAFSENTGVEMKDIKVYGWYNGEWELVQHLPVPNGNFYPESFGGDVNQYFSDSVKQTSTSKTIILREKNKIDAMNWTTGQVQKENCMYHPFSDIKNFDSKYEYIYTCIDLRKVKYDPIGIDDRNQTHYCANCGGDWWLAEDLFFHESWQHNKGVAQPKMIEITNEWRRFSMTTVPQNWTNDFPKER